MSKDDAGTLAMQYLERVGIAEQAARYPDSFPAASSGALPLPVRWACSPRS